MSDHTFTAGFLFCGLGAGALGFIEATAKLGKHEGRFESVGGIDLTPESCADFEMLTGSPATQADLSTMQPKALREAWGPRAPDVIFLSPPCKGFSRLLGKATSETEKYLALNRLVLQGIHLAISTWESPPSAIVIENVPGITSRGAKLLGQVRSLLAGAGYLFHEGMHDCGEVGGLAQHRRRYLMVARRPADVPEFIYRPPKLRVKGCGEVLGPLRLPEHPDAGRLHELPKISWLNWARLAMIPAGGDWRDLPPRVALAKTADNAGSFKGRPGLMGVKGWDQPSATVSGRASISGGNTPAAVADPRLSSPLKPGQPRREIFGRHGVSRWEAPVGVVAGSGSNGTGGIADPRLALTCSPRAGAYGVLRWEGPSGAVTGSMRIDNRPAAIAHPVVADRCVPEAYRAVDLETAIACAEGRAKPPKGMVPVILSPLDGTWHRPMTTLELAVLQGLPAELGLSGKRSAGWRERIGNAVPVGAAKAIATSVLAALVAGKVGFCLSFSGQEIWVHEEDRA